MLGGKFKVNLKTDTNFSLNMIITCAKHVNTIMWACLFSFLLGLVDHSDYTLNLSERSIYKAKDHFVDHNATPKYPFKDTSLKRIIVK